jgi:DNA uptake protein ComE-like DNA-binding protein
MLFKRHRVAIKRVLLYIFFIGVFSQVITAPRESGKSYTVVNVEKSVYQEEKMLINMETGITSRETDEKKVYINSADKKTLMALPGIGECLAERIIEYRKKFRFVKKSDIMFVRGIGVRKFDKIKELIAIK